MTLRLRLAVGAALLAAISSLSVATISYLVTQQRLNKDIDQSISTVLRRFQDPDQNLINALCAKGSGFGDRTDDVDATLLGGAPGVTLQCLDSDGQVLATIGPAVAVKFTACPSDEPNTFSPPKTVGKDDRKYAVASLRVASGFCIASARDLDETHRTLDSIRNRSALTGLVVTMVSGLGGLVAARRATSPILRLTNTAEEIANSNNLNVPLPAAGKSEVGRLAAAFGTMINTLKRAQTQQQQLIQNAEHELRTPLTSLHTNVETLRRYRDIDDATQEQILDDVFNELDELTSLVDEVILLSNGERDLGATEEISLGMLTQVVVDRWCQRSGRAIKLTRSEQPDDIAGRSVEVARAISNLVDNAIKFSPSDTTVEVQIEGRTVRVRDHGSGIKDSDVDQVFDRFFRSVEARSMPGSGLGLAIVAQIAESHRAIATVRNCSDGGAEFEIAFPGSP